MRDFQVGGAALGGLSAWYFYAYAGIQLPVGILTDRFGPRKLMSFAALVCALATFGFASSDGLLGASISRALIGFTVAFGFVGTLTIATYAFLPKRFAMLAGLMQSVGMFGAIAGQAPLRLVIESVGWRDASLALAGLALVISALCFFVIPRRPPSLRHQDENSGSVGGIRQGLGVVLKNSQSWYCAGIGFGLTAIMLSFSGLWAVPWFSSVHGFSKAEAAAIASMLFLGWAIMSPLAGWLSDHFERRKPVLLTGIIGNLFVYSLLLFWAPADARILSALMFLCGMSGSTMTVTFSAIRELNPVRFSGTSLGLMNMWVVGSGAVMQPVIGWLLDRNWQGVLVDGARSYSAAAYQSAFISLLMVNGIALLCLVMLKETRCRQLG